MMRTMTSLSIPQLLVPMAFINSVRTQRIDENNLVFDRGLQLLHNIEKPCPIEPPFLAPFPLSDLDSFKAISSCPFLIHKHVTGKNIDGCFPIYSIPHWNDLNSVLFNMYEFNLGTEKPLVFERKSSFANWEDLATIPTSSRSMLDRCIENLSYRVEGIHGEISGEHGTASVSAIVVSFEEYEKENAVLLPIGGCEVDSHETYSGRELEINNQGDKDVKEMTNNSATCSIRLDGIELNQCLEKCYTSIESNFINDLDKLTIHRAKRISKNNENRETVIGKLLITRANQLSTAFARCKCKHDAQDMSQCLLRIFLDVVVTENEYQFEIEESFDRHVDDVETWLQSNQKLACDASTSAAAKCRNEC